jgi:hypothetical protein
VKNFTKSCQEIPPARLASHVLCRGSQAGETWAYPWRDEALASTLRRRTGDWELDVHEELRDARRVNLGTVVPDPQGTVVDGVEPGHTLGQMGQAEVRMLLSFQRPPHLRRRVILPVVRPGADDRLPAQGRRV